MSCYFEGSRKADPEAQTYLAYKQSFSSSSNRNGYSNGGHHRHHRIKHHRPDKHSHSQSFY